MIATIQKLGVDDVWEPKQGLKLDVDEAGGERIGIFLHGLAQVPLKKGGASPRLPRS